VITHPYEGGHPDHDACAFVAAQSRDRFTLVEFASYNAFGHEFLVPGPGPRVAGVEEKSRNRAPGTRGAGRGTAAPQSELVITLTASERQNKRTMMACYETQVDVLAYFSAEVERFRIAPAYDFTSPPHDGPLNYEKWEWPMTGEEWRRLAAAALR
jgi:LmbE family N-acetylglucosaminyl deacetylase